MAELRIAEGEQVGKVFRLGATESAEITIGRDSTNSIVIDDNMVSRYHAVIHKIKDSYFIKDLESTNGTSVNGIPVPREKYIKLKPGDNIHIGRTDFSFV